MDIKEFYKKAEEKTINEAIILHKIENKKSSEDFTKEEIDFIFSHKKLFDHILFSPITLKGTINHNFLKGFKLQNKKARNYKGFFSNIGFYQDSKPTSSNYGKLCWSIKTDDKGTHDTSWWLNNDTKNKKFIINKNIEWEDARVNNVYLNTDYSRLYIDKTTIQNNIINEEENNDDLKVSIVEDENIIIIEKKGDTYLSLDNLKEITCKYAKEYYVIWDIDISHKKLGWINSPDGFRAYEDKIGKVYTELFDYVNSDEFKNNHNDVLIYLYTEEDNAGYVRIQERGYKRNVINLTLSKEIIFDRELVSYT